MADIAKVRSLINKHEIVEFYLTSAPLQAGWVVLFKYKNGKQEVLTKCRSKDHKIYKTSDTAIKAIGELGANIETKVIFN